MVTEEVAGKLAGSAEEVAKGESEGRTQVVLPRMWWFLGLLVQTPLCRSACLQAHSSHFGLHESVA